MPEWLEDFKKKYPTATYESREFSAYRGRIKNELMDEQHYLCAYCCRFLKSEKTINEHIEPQHPGTYISKKTLDYNNIVASCDGYDNVETCGKHKKNIYDPIKFISPLNPACEQVFTYYSDGTIAGNDYTINLLNLNAQPLCNSRKAVFMGLLDMELEDIVSTFLTDKNQPSPFIDVIEWYVKKSGEQNNSQNC